MQRPPPLCTPLLPTARFWRHANLLTPSAAREGVADRRPPARYLLPTAFFVEHGEEGGKTLVGKRNEEGAIQQHGKPLVGNPLPDIFR